MNILKRLRVATFALAFGNFAMSADAFSATPAISVPNITSCSNATLQGTVMGGGISIMNGAPLPWIWMEYWDGTGKSTWMEFDSYGTSNSGWFTGSQTYSVSSNCVAVDNYRYDPPGHPFIYFVNPDGSGLNYVNELAYGNVAADTAVKVSRANLMGTLSPSSTCNLTTLRGTYVASVVENVGGNVQARLTRRSFDGAGKLTYREDLEPVGGGAAVKTSGTGTYTVTAMCQAQISQSTAGASNTLVNEALVAPDGSAYWWVNITNTGVYAAGKATRVSQNSVNNVLLNP